MVGLTRNKYHSVPTQYLANRALIGLWIQTVQLRNANPDIRHF